MKIEENNKLSIKQGQWDCEKCRTPIQQEIGGGDRYVKSHVSAGKVIVPRPKMGPTVDVRQAKGEEQQFRCMNEDRYLRFYRMNHPADLQNVEAQQSWIQPVGKQFQVRSGHAKRSILWEMPKCNRISAFTSGFKSLIYSIIQFFGGVVERFIAPVLKTGELKRFRGFESRSLRHLIRGNNL